MQLCTKCNEEKEDGEFNKHKGTKSGLNSWCRLCEKVNSRSRYKQKASESKPVIHHKLCRKCNTDKGVDEFTVNNGTADGYHAYCKQCNIDDLRTPGGKKRRMCYSAKAKCKNTSVPFDLVPDDFDMPTHCPVLGIELCMTHTPGGPKDDAPSLDRFIPSLGYVKGNVMVMSQRANRLKNDASIEEVRLVLEFMEKHNC